jgi:predicted AAA+ superfamily ATPase
VAGLAAAKPTLRLLLTGSASIGRTGLDGADSLAGRAATFTLPPLTPQELAGEADNLRAMALNLLGPPPSQERDCGPPPRGLRDTIARGGLPQLALTELPPAACSRWVRDTVTSTLPQDVLPDE